MQVAGAASCTQPSHTLMTIAAAPLPAQVFPKLCPDGIDLLQKMFEYDPAKRITVRQGGGVQGCAHDCRLGLGCMHGGRALGTPLLVPAPPRRLRPGDADPRPGHPGPLTHCRRPRMRCSTPTSTTSRSARWWRRWRTPAWLRRSERAAAPGPRLLRAGPAPQQARRNHWRGPCRLQGCRCPGGTAASTAAAALPPGHPVQRTAASGQNMCRRSALLAAAHAALLSLPR